VDPPVKYAGERHGMTMDGICQFQEAKMRLETDHYTTNVRGIGLLLGNHPKRL